MIITVLGIACLCSLGLSDRTFGCTRDIAGLSIPAPAGQAQRSQQKINWRQRYNELAQRVDSRMDEPRGYPSDLGIYLQWLDTKAVDRDEAKNLLKESLDVLTGDPDWALEFQKLLDKAQRSGEGTAWDAAYKFLRIKRNDGWQDILHKIQTFGRPLYTKTAETAFDPVFIKDTWVNCLINFCINNVEAGSQDIALYQGQQAVFGEFGEDGLIQIPKRDFDTLCERRINFHIEDKGEPQVPADKGLAWVEEIRKECDWWSFGKERTDATNLMEQYYKDDLCLFPNDKSHKWFKELAEKYRLNEGVEYNEGFYAKLKGQVWAEEGSDKKPAEGAHVTVTDPKDGTKWETDAGQDGKYEIKRALLHAPRDKKGWKRCPVFKISATYKGDRVDDTYEGTLLEPDRNAEHTKDLTIKVRPQYETALTITSSSETRYRYDHARGGQNIRHADDEVISATVRLPLVFDQSLDVPDEGQRWEYYHATSRDLSSFSATSNSERFNRSDYGDIGAETTRTVHKTASDAKFEAPFLNDVVILAFDKKSGQALKATIPLYDITYTWHVEDQLHIVKWSPQSGTKEEDTQNPHKESVSYHMRPVEEQIPDPTANAGQLKAYVQERYRQRDLQPPANIPEPKKRKEPKIHPEFLIKSGDGRTTFGGEGKKTDFKQTSPEATRREEKIFRWELKRTRQAAK
jgi:hypothetical protein